MTIYYFSLGVKWEYHFSAICKVREWMSWLFFFFFFNFVFFLFFFS